MVRSAKFACRRLSLWTRMKDPFSLLERVQLDAPVYIERCDQKNECHILRKLDLSMILAITNNITPLDKVLLGQTCSQFRAVFEIIPGSVVSGSHRGPEVHIRYLAIKSRDCLDMWACERCHTLHRVNLKDTTDGSLVVACRWDGNRRPGDDFFFDHWPAHRHVQMALKLHGQGGRQQSDPEQRDYYRELTRSLTQDQVVPNARTRLRPPWLDTYKTSPKIVQGRFLLKTVYTYNVGAWDLPDPLLGCDGNQRFAACTHQRAYSERAVGVWRHNRRMHPETYPRVPGEELDTAVKSAAQSWGQIIEGSCPQCPTDFTVQIWQSAAVVCTWSDLGGEAPINDEIWSIYKPEDPQLQAPIWRRVMDHEAGSVKRLYENI